jgi:hypothetical protein
MFEKHMGLPNFWTLSIVQCFKQHNVSKIGSITVSGERVGGTYFVGPIRKANLN